VRRRWVRFGKEVIAIWTLVFGEVEMEDVGDDVDGEGLGESVGGGRDAETRDLKRANPNLLRFSGNVSIGNGDFADRAADSGGGAMSGQIVPSS
jgi:hypothetical protein